MALEIVSVLQPGEEATKPRAIKGPADVPNAPTQPKRGWWVLLGVGSLLAVAAVWRLIIRRQEIDAITLAKEQVVEVGIRLM